MSKHGSQPAAEMGESSGNRFTPDAIQAVCAAISEAGGNEVFFAGALDGKGKVEKVRVAARGHTGAVPAIFEGLRTREVVIHNHPSGNINPSEADLELAAAFGNHGHGVYIVDNAVERVYVVVEPFLPEEFKPLDGAELAARLGPGCPIARRLQDYEERPQQIEMLKATARAFNHDGVAVIEAPTGVGKTLAYLLPAVKWAHQNRERVVVSTRTINLQEQIIHQDIPLLAKALDRQINAVLVKGRSNYLCLRKLNRARSEASLFEDEASETMLQSIAEWAEKTEDGSLSDLSFVPPHTLWERLCSEADTCSSATCPNPKRCFIGKARRDIAKADVIVVNHHMLFSDLAIKQEIGNFSAQAVLPAYHRVILDEAHSLEDAATAYFGAEVTRNGAIALLGRFIRAERGKDRGLLPFIKLTAMKLGGRLSADKLDDLYTLMDNELQPALAAARDGLVATFSAVRSWTAEKCEQIGQDVRLRLTPELIEDAALREIHTVYAVPAAEDVLKCAEAARKLHKKLKALPIPPGDEEHPFLMELLQLDSYQNRLRRLANALIAGTRRELESNTVRWIEIDSTNSRIVRIARCPLDVGEPLAEWVYNNLHTLVMTSATLTVNQRFDFFLRRIGADRIPEERLETLILKTPFDYAAQAMLAVPQDIPPPDDSRFLDASAAYIGGVLQHSRGHAFVLFTSFHALNHAHRKLNATLREMGITPLKQGDANRHHLLERFRADPSSVLFATDSFWEGVDVAGESLQCVILPRLPFRVPTEPIQQARAEAIDAAGGNSFMEYTVPQAVIKFRQGFGRLIRRQNDFGVVAVLDSRVLTKHYGKIFLRSLPDVRIVKGPGKGVLLALQGFFERKRQTHG